jgi:hypothetical protein
MKKAKYLLFVWIGIVLYSCKDDIDLSPKLVGSWKQEQVWIDDAPLPLTSGELNTTLKMEETGIYYLFDGETEQEHPGTWLFSDGDWLNLSMDKIQGVNKDGSFNFGQVLVRFTILKFDCG